LSNNSKRPRSSKRNGLRLCCNNHTVIYKTAYDEGEAHLVNISSGGCFFESANLPLSVREKIFISIELKAEQNIIEAKAIIVRAQEDAYAAKFILIEPATQGLIRSYFTQQLHDQQSSLSA